MDGSQKLPQRWIATVRDNLAAGRSVHCLALSIAGWMRYVCGRDESGRAIDVADPLSARFAALSAANAGDPRGVAHALFAIDSIFGGDLRADPRIVEPVTEALSALFEVGAARTLERFESARGG
jgi:fructuronate reductase